MAGLEGPYGFLGVGVGAVLELGLAVYILVRLGPSPSSRFLAGSVLTHALFAFVVAFFGFMSWGGLGLAERWGIRLGGHDDVWAFASVSAILLLGMLWPGMDLGFALTYPVPGARIRAHPWLLGLLLLPAAAFAAAAPYAVVRGVPEGLLWYADGFLVTATLAAFSYLLGATIASGTLFWRRMRIASDAWERGRLRFILLAYTLPLGVICLGWLLLMVAESLIPAGWEEQVVEGWALPILLGSLALAPPLALAYGVLRYRLFDWDRRVARAARAAISKSALAVTFVLVFFLLAEWAEHVVSERTQSNVVGLLGAAVFAVAALPLERRGRRLLERVLPEPARPVIDPEHVYRTTFQDYASRGGISRAERRALDALARTLHISPARARALQPQSAKASVGTTPPPPTHRARARSTLR
jgi:hypothetical protein